MSTAPAKLPPATHTMPARASATSDQRTLGLAAKVHPAIAIRISHVAASAALTHGAGSRWAGVFFAGRNPHERDAERRDSGHADHAGDLVERESPFVGFTIGNDMSSRDIEGENLLYLPQAKIYARSCAVGPWIVVGPTEDEARQ